MKEPMPAEIRHTFISENAGERLDKALAGELPHLSRTFIQRLIKEGQVSVNGGTMSKSALILEGGEEISILIPPEKPVELLPENTPLDIIYQDNDLVIINKPAGMVVHPAAGHSSGTMVNALIAQFPQISSVGPQLRPGIVHRLDSDTSGIILAALSVPAFEKLKAQFKARAIEKTYITLVHGCVSPPEGLIDAPIGRSKHRRKRMAVIQDGRVAQTRYRTLENFNEYTLLQVQPLTGRTHQIRVHLAFLGFPVVGDQVYGRRKHNLPLKRQFLHAYRLSFTHPIVGRPLTATAVLQNNLTFTLNILHSEWSSDPSSAILD